LIDAGYPLLKAGSVLERRNALYGRQKGKPLSARRSRLMATLYKALAINLSAPAAEGLSSLFPAPVGAVRLEIGFGGGEHLIHEATGTPNVGFIGVEPFAAGMAKAVSAIDHTGLRNIRLFDGDAAHLLDWLPPASLDRVDLLYPDPWPKRRHWKRRFVSQDNLDRLSRVIAPGKLLRFASDIPSYVEWTLLHLAKRDDFEWTAETADDWRRPFPGWPGTRYEAKAIAAGRRPAYLAFRRR
jgi:tRNA (guanine-N7-)-methyltransferase